MTTSHRSLCFASLALAGWAALAACGAEEPYDFERAPIVLVDLSGLRADRLGTYGGAATPRLDELAAGSVVFEWAFTPSPHAGPARAALLTGRYPVALGVLADGGELAAETVTLAERLAGSGYRTAAFVAGDAGVGGLDQGFDLWETSGGSPAEVFERAAAWLSDAGRAPSFLFVQVSLEEGPEADYDRSVADADAALGELLAALGSEPRAVVAVTSDHGVTLPAERSDPDDRDSDAVEAQGPSDVAVGVARVPLLLRLPRPLERREPRVTDLVDLAPTLLDLVGIEPDPRTQGESLVAILDQRGRPPYLAFTDSIDPEGGLAVAMAGYRLVLERGTDRAALYRLTDDPLERADLAAEEPEKVAVLRRRLEEWQRAVIAGTGDGEGVSADEEMLEQLRNLGYVQ